MIVYKTTNLINGKIYVGYDTKNRPNYYGSGKYYKRAERKHGKENFRKSIIDSSEDFDDLCVKEIFWIDKLDARNPLVGYNIDPGGKGTKEHSNEAKEKLRARVFSAEHKAKISDALRGRTASAKTKKNMSLVRTGILFQEEHKKKISAALQGHTVSEETRRKIGLAHKGKIISDETKQKMREAAKQMWQSREHVS